MSWRWPNAFMALLLFTLSGSTASAQSDFWKSWSDGQAEMNGYAVQTPRYGAIRTGYAVLVYVTEPFSRSRLVKADYAPGDPDQFTALKLNLIERFQTGIYNYALMTSVFTDPTQGFRPLKTSFTSQEWCGHVFEEVRHLKDRTEVETRSYFDGETKNVKLAPGLRSEDALFVIARGLAQGGPTAHTNERVRILGASHRRRLSHQPAVPFETTLDWGPIRTVKVPAGRFQVRTVAWGRQDGVKCSMDVSVRSPWSIVGWRCDDGERAVLTGSTRGAYWQQVKPGDESLLKALGLKAPVWR